MLYGARAKEPGGRWRKYEKIKGDLVYESKGQALPVRVLIMENEARVEIPMSWLIEFGPERFMSIKQDMESDINQSVRIKK